MYGNLVSFIAIQSLCEDMLSQIFTDITTWDTHTHTDSTSHLYQKWFKKLQDQMQCSASCLSPIGSCYSVEEVQLIETVACHCHGNVDVASRVMQSQSPSAL